MSEVPAFRWRAKSEQLEYLKDFRTENGSRQGQNLALTS